MGFVKAQGEPIYGVNSAKNDDLLDAKKGKLQWESIVNMFGDFKMIQYDKFYNDVLDIYFCVKKTNGFFIVKNKVVIFDTCIEQKRWSDIYLRLKEVGIVLKEKI